MSDAGAKPAAVAGGRRIPPWLMRLAEMAVVAFATVMLSILIQKVSGPALWLPSEWRTLLVTVFPLLCTGVLMPTIRAVLAVALPHASEHAEPIGHDADEGARKKAHAAGRQKMFCHLIAVAFAAVTVFALCRLMLLRSECVRTFQPAVDFAGEFKETKPPFFVDLENSQMLTPMEWPREMQEYFRAIARDRGEPDGLAWLLDHSPYEVVQRLQSSPGKEALHATVWRFVSWYMVFVTSLTAALVVAMNPREFFIEEVLGKVLGGH